MEPISTAGGAEEEHHGNYSPNPSAEAPPGKHAVSEALEEVQEELIEHQPLEQEDLNFEKWKPKPKPKRTLHEKAGDVKTYLWNAETREFMGRTGHSWFLIILFYTALYAFLAAMFGACMWCLMLSISPYHPTHNDRVMPPGMTMSPQLDGHYEIAFNASDRKSWKKYAKLMEEQLRPYNDAVQEQRNIQCPQDAYFMQDEQGESAERKACQFKRSWLGECSGLQDPHFGFSQGKPCILLRMNRILGYLPGHGTPVNVTCGVKKGAPESLGELQFFPKSIFNLMYYPYYGKLRHVNYTAPVVAVRFNGLQYDTHIVVKCKLNGKGIINDSPTDRFLGSVSFSFDVGA
ncbi:protein ATP1B4 [Oncorhynchus kisutch]|uniref:Sodium/potassium-transporting ATPase subunit beta n=1 Tax=Oncorhynchus kisutch TaxID=8019 RepID=A0A8C7HU73_ONCKI|nr:protein ATP1B4 [Oncorhynchus kisutch]XP_046151755.1 protein ATP1B4-like [Oncorhynchus gorbuscha]XP_046151756.1 protein ATP1B4-like [Oncorhynchus gorbuscha]XP_046151757.1 protein ATP1B4-like [Oncorhynchus gorbuscha]XP_046151758.1 protein ATP1B4-like [Oncorhynchus gorbuscha]XP_052367964.1 protein ATP1B4-like [Oncorhynchus keta]XP_052367971.1 protein ATP1B4-like [Oncorhynchus keta]XP_052367975.1 protein ATP1B4-like [Oncorhynchus keta]XP_052367981.1 protein ATP1B4-like [Oncorhynchus keta]XP